MNKSKFLKKSLAMVLAVMLVVAMIPLGASAAPGTTVVNDGTVLTIATARGTLEGSGTSYTDTLTYDENQAETLTVAVDPTKGYDTVKAVVTDDTGTDAAEATGLTINVPNGSKKVTFYAASTTDADKKSATYTVTMNQPAPSTDVTLKAAKMDGTIEGTVNNSAKTISFTVPWGYAGSKVVTAEMNYPVTGSAPTVTVPNIGDTDVSMSVTSQFGNTDAYSIITKEMECISGITVAGVAGVLDTKEGSATKGEYIVTLPEGTNLDEKVVVNYRPVSNAGVKIASATWAGDPFTNGGKVTVADATKYELVLTSDATPETHKAVKVNIVLTKSNDATIKSFTATATNDKGDAYKENGTVTDKELTVVLPYKSDLTNVDLEIEVAEGASVVTGLTGLDLSEGKKVLIDVVAADNKTHKYYEVSATTAESPYGTPAITGSVLTIGAGKDAVEYNATVSNNTVTFVVPYATTDTTVKDGTYTWAKSFATNLSPISYGSDIFKDTNEIVVTSDAGDSVTYTLVFKKEAAKTGKTVSGVSLSTAATSDKVTADNTYNVTVSGTKATITLPYSFKAATGTALHATFDVPEGAALYFNDFAGTAANLNTTPIASGYNADDAESNPKQPKNTITVANLIAGDPDFTTKIVVADETAKVLLASAGTVTLEDLEDGEYKGHVTIYDIEPKFAPAETGHTLSALTADKGLVTAKISGTSVEITVPASYVATDATKFFYPEYNTSKLATVRANTTLTGEELNGPVADATVAAAGAVQVREKTPVSGDTPAVYALYAYDGTAFDTEVTKLVVDNELKSASTLYTVTVKVAPAETGADVTSLKVNNTVGTINKTAKTVTVTLPYGTDLTAVTMEYEVSKLAKAVLAGATATTVDDVTTYDVSKPFTITVTAEDTKTVKVYTVTVTASQQFSDVKATDYFYNDVYAAASAGIVNGKPNGTFGPRENITRKDFALMVVRMLGVEEEAAKYTTTTFTDVAKDYAMGAIAYCAENGIINGDGKGHFNPGKSITREDAALMIARALKLDMSTTSTGFKDDAKIGSWAKAGVAACAKAEIIKGNNGNYMPKDNIQRCDAAAILVRALNK